MSSDTKTDVPGLTDGAPTFPSFSEGETDATRTAVEPRAVDDFPTPTEIGRYVVDELIGSGGMGVVFRAHDPELGRSVAVKLLRARGRSPQKLARATQRLLREAQALAQLSHPNVVAVHDVGEVDVGVFIAMEFIEGRTLRSLIKEGPLAVERAVQVFLQAGEGLAAAHAHGLVHRDFKPANMMIDDHGRVRVLDFGLARAEGLSTDDESSDDSTETPDTEEGRSERSSSRNLLSSPLTAYGAVVGTPAYMPVEQRLGATVNARSDQFSFCVAFYEALTGERPVLDEPDPDRERRLIDSRVPRWLRRIVLRGMSEHAAARFPSMRALLTALRRGGRRWKRGVAGALVAVVVTTVLVWAIWLRGPGTSAVDRCVVGAGQVDEIWSGQQRSTLSTAFTASKVAHAADTARRVATALDGYASAWQSQYRSTCRAHHEQGQLSAALFDVSMQCMAERRNSLTSIVTVLTGEVDRVVVNEAVRAVSRLPSVAACADLARLRETYPAPKDPARRASARRIGARLAEADALLKAGKSKRGQKVVTSVFQQLEALDHPPLSARGYLLRGNLALDLNRHDEATKMLKRAAEKGAQAGDDRTTARAWILRMRSLLLRAKFDEAMAMSEAAKVAVLRVRGDPAVRGHLDYNMAWLLVMKNQSKKARVHADQALANFRSMQPRDDAQVALALIMSGNVAITTGNTSLAEKHLTEAITLLEATLGRDHPDIADARHNLAHMLVQQGRPEDALAHAEAALRIVRHTFDDSHPRLATALWILGQIQHKRGKLVAARRLVSRALKIFDAHDAGNPTQAAFATNILALISAAEGRHAAADRLFADARRRFVAVFGDKDAAILDVLVPWAKTKSALGQASAARRLRRQAAALNKSTATSE